MKRGGSLRRTALTRKAELRRTPMPRRTRELKARTARVVARARDTGPTAAVRRLVCDRAGWSCELCGVRLHDGVGWLGPHSLHHRQPRGLGGSSRLEINSPANLLLLCGSATTPGGCHEAVERNRDIAYVNGWLVKRPTDPATVPVAVHAAFPGVYVLLTAGGFYEAVAA